MQIFKQYISATSYRPVLWRTAAVNILTCPIITVRHKTAVVGTPMIGLVALTVVAVITALALRRVRDKVLTALAVAGLVLLSIPAVLVNGDAAERLVAVIYMYAPYWEYLVPVAFFTLALLPNGKGRRKKRSRYVRREVVTV